VERLVRIGFWGLNVGLALMIVLDLFPAGVLQLWDSIANGYWHARQPAFTMSGPFHTLEWVRLVGDGVFLVAGVMPLVAATVMVVLEPGTRRSEARALGA
jgi:nitric oxide reductase subunit B